MGAHDQSIDLITADVRLLPGDGLKAVHEICRKRDIPVIFITAYAEELQDRAPEALIVQKPVKPEALASAVRQALKRSSD
jgi:CheY-like chemotaxis protein